MTSTQEDKLDENQEESSMSRRRGPYKRKHGNKEPKSQSKCSSMSLDEDEEMDNATQRLLQQVKKSLTKASTPSGDQQPSIKQEGSSSLGTSSTCTTPEPTSQEGFVMPPLGTEKGALSQLRIEDSLPPNSIRSGSTNASPLKNVFPSILTGSESELLSYSPRSRSIRQSEGTHIS